MSDEELGDALVDHTKRLVTEEPELILQAAQAAGWQVVPPVEPELVDSKEADSP